MPERGAVLSLVLTTPARALLLPHTAINFDMPSETRHKGKLWREKISVYPADLGVSFFMRETAI